jgi:predicted SPOUT superfamily RNA methylase MTH1
VAMGTRRTLVVDGSVVEGAASLEAASLVAWRVASAAARHEADEVVVLRAASSSAAPPPVAGARVPPARGQGAAFLARLLQFFETPPYLRRALIPRHPDLAMVGALPRHHPSPPEARVCAMPHHLKIHQWRRHREGVVVPEKNPVKPGKSTLADVGLGAPVALDRAVKLGVRVTVELPDQPPTTHGNTDDADVIAAAVVSPAVPRAVGYWGFDVRLANAAEDHPAAETHEDEGVRYRLVASTR